MQKFLNRWMPEAGSAHAAQIDMLMGLLHWLMAVLFVGWTLYFIYVLFRFRASKNPTASYTGSTSHFSTYIEAGVVIVEVILLVGFAIPAWARWVTPHAPEAGAMQVRVVAEQFAWNVQYPGTDGVFGQRDIELVDASNPLGLDLSDPFAKDDITTINQLHMPVDGPITILLSSKDVIHSFSLPAMRVKQDSIPGMEIPVHFTPILTTPEESQFPGCAANQECWEIACAQLCGLGHYRMRGFYQVHSQDSFDAWMAGQVAALNPGE